MPIYLDIQGVPRNIVSFKSHTSFSIGIGQPFLMVLEFLKSVERNRICRCLKSTVSHPWLIFDQRVTDICYISLESSFCADISLPKIFLALFHQ